MTTWERPKLVRRIAQGLSRRSYPRTQLTLMVTTTGFAGFLSSFTLLHLGLKEMWLRYPVSVLISYGTFLLLLNLWIVYQQGSLGRDLWDASDFDPTDFIPSPSSNAAISCSDHSSAFGCSDLFSGSDADEWVAIIVFLAAMLAALIASILIVVSAPNLLAELFLDAVLIAELRKRMIRVVRQHWARAAIRKTVIPFATVALIFSLAGGIIHQVRPEANSIGGVFHTESAERQHQ